MVAYISYCLLFVKFDMFMINDEMMKNDVPFYKSSYITIRWNSVFKQLLDVGR